MSELRSLVEMMGQWPMLQGMFIIVLAMLGIATYLRGERDRRSLGSAAIEIPMYLLSGPLADSLKSVHEISEQTKRTNRLLEQLLQELQRQNQLLEWAGNQAGMSTPPKRIRGQ